MKVGTDGVLLGACMTLNSSDRTLLDIGTGTGVVSLLCAQRLSELGADFGIEAIDIDLDSAGEAALNFSESEWSGRLRAEHSPLQAYRTDATYDCIFSNPPYYDMSLKNPDPRDCTARHTESLSYREICSFAQKRLATDGRLSLILPSDCEKELLRTAASYSLHPFRIVRIRTAAGKPVRRIIAEFIPSMSHPDLSEEEINLQEPNPSDRFYPEKIKTHQI